MKPRIFVLVSLAVLPLTFAQQAAKSADSAAVPASQASRAELAALEQFLDLSDAELKQAADAIARVRTMTPEQRAALRKEIAAFRQLPAAQRQQIRAGWGWMPPEIQNGWREMMQSATPEEHAVIQSKLQSLTPEQRTAYRRSLVEAYLKAKAEKK